MQLGLEDEGFRARLGDANAQGGSLGVPQECLRLSVRAGESIAIGDVRTWSIEEARTEANRLRVLVDSGTDPREQRREKANAVATKKTTEAARAIKVREAWDVYVEDRRQIWSDNHYHDHVRKAKAGGLPIKRGSRGRGVTIDGPLYPLMQLKLEELTAAVIQAWAAQEAKRRPTRCGLQSVPAGW